jgi:hypothetical protein
MCFHNLCNQLCNQQLVSSWFVTHANVLRAECCLQISRILNATCWFDRYFVITIDEDSQLGYGWVCMSMLGLVSSMHFNIWG